MRATKDVRTDAARMKDAAGAVFQAITALKRAAGHLKDEHGELAFCGQIEGAIADLTHTENRLRQYAANGW